MPTALTSSLGEQPVNVKKMRKKVFFRFMLIQSANVIERENFGTF